MDPGTVTALTTALGPSATIAVIWLIGDKQRRRATSKPEPITTEQWQHLTHSVERLDESVRLKFAETERRQMEVQMLLDKDGANGLVAEYRKTRARVHWLHDAIMVMCVQLKVDPPDRDWPE